MFSLFSKKAFCKSPTVIALKWKQIVESAGFIVENEFSNPQDARYVMKGIVRPFGSGDAKLVLRHLSSVDAQGLEWEIQIASVGLARNALTRLLLSCGCFIEAIAAPTICHAMFSCRLDADLLSILQSFDYIIDSDCRNAKVVEFVDSVIGDELGRMVGKRASGTRPLSLFVGTTAENGPYFAILARSVSYGDWIVSEPHGLLVEQCARFGFSQRRIVMTPLT